MHFTSSILTVLAASGLVAAFPGAPGYGSSTTTSSSSTKKLTTICHTTSTCSAVYSSGSSVYSKPVTTTVTTTVYKPSTYTTTVPSTYTKSSTGESPPHTSSLLTQLTPSSHRDQVLNHHHLLHRHQALQIHHLDRYLLHQAQVHLDLLALDVRLHGDAALHRHQHRLVDGHHWRPQDLHDRVAVPGDLHKHLLYSVDVVLHQD